MMLAVKFYAQVDNPRGIPGVWPAQVIELGESTDVPEGFMLMTKAHFDSYCEQYAAMYEAWEASLGEA
jgi:hypothetical protein